MDCSKLSFSLIVLLIVLFIQLVAGAEPVFYSCTSYKNFTANSSYDKNFNILLQNLYYYTPVSGFSNLSVLGNNESIYGSALCRGDVSSADCKACLLEAKEGIRQKCPYNIAANIWYEYCYLEYSNFNSLGSYLGTAFFLRSEYNVSSSKASFPEIQEFLSQLSDEASASEKLFADGVGKLEESALSVYGLVQCPLVLSPANCSICINNEIKYLSSVFDGKGAQFVSSTCNLRYEFFPFFKT